MELLITGGAGFIGSNYVRHRIAKHPEDSVRVLDKLTYAGRRENLAGLDIEFVEGDVADRNTVRQAVSGCDAIVNFAAESHVDRSIQSPEEFITTDVFGTYVLVEAARDAGIRHVQISTDEVYGDLPENSATETSPLSPSSPYSASKAGADHIVSAFVRTYGIDAVITRASNNYGPWQHPEKLIPLCILNALASDRIPIHGDGHQIRNWLYVEDFCRAIDIVLERGEAGQVYNAGGPDEIENLEVVRQILALTDRGDELIEHVTDRPGQDRRYSLASHRLEALGWKPQTIFADGIRHTVEWYVANSDWWQPIRSGEFSDYFRNTFGRELDQTWSAS